MQFTPNRATVLALAVAAASAQAQSEQALETVTVTGQALPSAITTLSNSDLRPVRDTGDALRDLLGVAGSRMGGHGIDPAVRGLSQTQINILLDGAYVHGGCPNRMDPPTSYAGASAYEEITLIRGTQTLEYGGGGPGGTILFERRTDPLAPGEMVRGKINAFWRDNDAAGELGADVTFGGRDAYLRVIAGHTEADDYRDGNGDRIRSSYRETSGSVILGYRFDDDSLVELNVDMQQTRDALFPGAGMDSPESENRTTRLKYTTSDLGPLATLKFEAYQSQVDHVMDNYSLRPNMGMMARAPSTSDTTGGRLVATQITGARTWKYGIDVQNNARSARRWVDNGPVPVLNSTLWPDVNIDQTGLFGEMKHALSGGYELIAGIRYDHVVSDAEQSGLDPQGMPLSPDTLYAMYYDGATARERTDHNWGGLLRLEHTASDGQLGWYAGLAQSMRTPDATERYIASNGMTPSSRWVGNPDLEPEQHRQFEVGGIAQLGAVEADLSLYYNDVDDFVLRDRSVMLGNNATIYRNIEATLFGGEARFTWAIDRHWTAQFGAAYVHAENTTDDRAIAQIQPLEGFARVDWRNARWEATANLQAQATQTRVDLDSSSGIAGQGLDVRETPGWGVLNLSARYRIADNWTAELGIDNAFDKAYSQHLNRANAFDPEQFQVNEPGRSVWIGIRGTL